jgi:hypothetical protein
MTAKAEQKTLAYVICDLIAEQLPAAAQRQERLFGDVSSSRGGLSTLLDGTNQR